MRFTVERDFSVFFIEDQGWLGEDCPRDQYPKPALELRFKSLGAAQKVCDALNTEWLAFESCPQ